MTPTLRRRCRDAPPSAIWPRTGPDNDLTRRLAQARHVRRRLRLILSPTASTLRANPYPEVTDPICRLPLPTLFYRLEAVHLGDLLRIWVRSGTKIKLPPSDFQGPARAHRTPQEPWRFAGTTTLSRVEPIPGCPSLKKKRKLFPGLSLTSPSSFALPRLSPRRDLFSLSRLGNFNPIPFRLHASVLQVK